jgi:holo-[acyl-carrier protein] synthase
MRLAAVLWKIQKSEAGRQPEMNMIVGIGIDEVEIERVKKACGSEHFRRRVFTEEECRQAGDRISVLAGSFAVKEAVAKALGTGFRNFGPWDIEVLRDPLGKPYTVLRGGAKARAEEIGAARIHVSVTDTAEIAAAIAVAERLTKEDEP